jgi:hypothetical protein
VRVKFVVPFCWELLSMRETVIATPVEGVDWTVSVRVGT